MHAENNPPNDEVIDEELLSMFAKFLKNDQFPQLQVRLFLAAGPNLAPDPENFGVLKLGAFAPAFPLLRFVVVWLSPVFASPAASLCTLLN